MSGVDWIVGVARDPQGGWGVGHCCRSTVRSSYSEIILRQKVKSVSQCAGRFRRHFEGQSKTQMQ